MDMQGALSGRWLSKNEIDEEGQMFKIKRVSVEQVGDAQEDKFALHLLNLEKLLLLNKTNMRILVDNYGGESDAWTGKPVHIYFDPNISYAGQRTGGIRLKVPKAPKAPAPSGGNKGKSIADMESDIPF